MRRPRRPKPIFYICDAIRDGQLLSQRIEAKSLDEAIGIFAREYGIRPQIFHGPFSARRDRNLGTKEIVFTTTSLSAIYNDWKVKAILLSSPSNCAYLFFQSRVDGKIAPRPQGTFIVKCEDLKYEKNK